MSMQNLIDRALAGALPKHEAEQALKTIAQTGAVLPLSNLAVLAAAVTPDMLTNGLTNLITAKIQKIWYDYPDDWKKWTSQGKSDYLDQQTIEIVESLGMADELKKTGGEFNVKHIPDATAATYDIYGYGNLAEANMRALKSDRIGFFDDIADRFARSMWSRFNETLYVDKLQSNPTVYDSNSLFDSTNHGNDNDSSSAGKALSYAELINCLALADAMTDGQSEAVGAEKWWIISGHKNWEPAQQIFNNQFRPGSANRDFNAARSRIAGIVLNRKLNYDWYLVADKKELPGLEVCFFQGKQEPTVVAEKSDTSVGYQFTRPGHQRWRVEMWLGTIWKSYYAAIRGSTNNSP